ncbi:MAG: DUF2203 domain-containing protein [Gemmatimonadaceae bacterium]|nr:DUF2203 domain-containing protein [Gemmatimonadaceae bacterium]
MVDRDAHTITADEPWTPERANKALPLVRRITDDVVMAFRKWQELVERFELASLRSTPDAQDPEAERLQREVQMAAREVQGFVAELGSLGVECKSYELGLVDFPGERDGEPVYYCWQRGEPEVAHWHARDAGFAGRQPL